MKAPPTDDADGADDDPTPVDPDLEKLYNFVWEASMSGMGGGHGRSLSHQQVCGKDLPSANLDCIRGKCSKCGFKRLWSKGLRPKLVDPFHKLRPGVSRVWLTKMQWDRVKSGGDGSSSEDDLRQRCEGTLIELLDATELVETNTLGHSFHIEQSKVAARECDQHVGPCMLCDDSDWSENGEIVIKKQMQMEYWVTVYYSLLISITAFLVTANWMDKRSALAAGTEVTVELSEREVTTEVVAGSYFAVVERGSTEVGYP